MPVISGDLFKYFEIAFITNPKQSSAANDAKSKDQLPSVYIPFGYLLAILQSSGLLYNTDKDKPEEVNEIFEPTENVVELITDALTIPV